MHIQKLLPICVAAIVVASSLNLHATDNDIQAKAREALRQKMAELETQGGSTNSSKSISPKPAPAAPVAPVVVAPTPAPAPAPAPAPVVPTAATPEPAPVTPAVAPSVAGTHRLTPEELEKAMAAEREAVAKLEAEDRAKTKAVVKEGSAPKHQMEKQPEMVKTTPALEMTKVSEKTPAPVMPPPTAAELSREQKLNDLLQLYKSDKISPSEYHQERAKILGLP